MAARIVSDIILKDKEEKSGPRIEIEEEPIQDIELPKPFLSANRHSSTTTEDLSERWGAKSSPSCAHPKSYHTKYYKIGINATSKKIPR